MHGSPRAIPWQFELVVGVLGLVVLLAGVTVQLDISLMDGYWDFQLPKYFESLDKLGWVDTTYEVYTKELAHSLKEVEDIREEYQDTLAWIASTGMEGHDVVLGEHGHLEVKWDLVRKVQFSDPNITEALDLAGI